MLTNNLNLYTDYLIAKTLIQEIEKKLNHGAATVIQSYWRTFYYS